MLSNISHHFCLHTVIQCGQKAHSAADSWLTHIFINDTPAFAACLQVPTGSKLHYLQYSPTVSCGSYQKILVFRLKLIIPVTEGRKKYAKQLWKVNGLRNVLMEKLEKKEFKNLFFFLHAIYFSTMIFSTKKSLALLTKLMQIMFAEWHKDWKNNHPSRGKVTVSQFGFLSLNVALAEEHKGNDWCHINLFIFMFKTFSVNFKEDKY